MAPTLFVGIDEAGYGPNLGPLVVGMSAFEADADWRGRDWWRELRDVVGRAGDRSALWVDDSKAVLSRSNGFERLSATIHFFLELQGRQALGLVDLFEAVASDAGAELHGEHWCDDCQRPFAPATLDADWGARWANRGVAIRELRASVAFPRAFNERLAIVDSKAEVEIERIRGLLASALAASADERVVVAVDRLGGRKNYRALVEDLAGETFPRTIEETPRRSAYRWEAGDREFEIEFLVGGDQSSFPIALASMLAKYVRERCMESFNAFWTTTTPGLAPTAGYPVDAKRFLDAIRPELDRRGVAIKDVWRQR